MVFSYLYSNTVSIIMQLNYIFCYLAINFTERYVAFCCQNINFVVNRNNCSHQKKVLLLLCLIFFNLSAKKPPPERSGHKEIFYCNFN